MALFVPWRIRVLDCPLSPTKMLALADPAPLLSPSTAAAPVSEPCTIAHHDGQRACHVLARRGPFGGQSYVVFVLKNSKQGRWGKSPRHIQLEGLTILRTADGDMSDRRTIERRAYDCYGGILQVEDPDEIFVKSFIHSSFDL